MINASDYFDNLNISQAVDKVLFCIKTKGPISTAVIAKDLAMTGGSGTPAYSETDVFRFS
ncbi:hypothetical protein PY546_18065 [Providencia stuartii]|nr:hypothetical protein [Providencia stuartii]